VQPEPISPELVLVDPVLAERERQRLCEKARLAELLAREPAPPRPDGAVVDVAMLRRAVEQDGGVWEEDEASFVRRDLRAFALRKLLPAALMCSVLANGILAAEFVVRTDSQQAALGVPVAEHPTSVEPVTPAGATSALPEQNVVEQKLISLIIAAPARKLPRAFVDPRTGLVRNNVRVTCRKTQSRSYRCMIQLPGGEPGSLVVRYRFGRGGRGVFTWYGYRRSKGTERFLQNQRAVRAEKTK
jgi:hypothetical protein